MLQEDADIAAGGPMLAQKGRTLAGTAQTMAEEHDRGRRFRRGQIDADGNSRLRAASVTVRSSGSGRAGPSRQRIVGNVLRLGQRAAPTGGPVKIRRRVVATHRCQISALSVVITCHNPGETLLPSRPPLALGPIGQAGPGTACKRPTTAASAGRPPCGPCRPRNRRPDIRNS